MADDRRDDADDASGDFSLSLPPIRLPPLFPDRFRVLWPGGGGGPAALPSPLTATAGLAAFDLADAALAVWVHSPPAVDGARVLAGSLVAGAAFGLPGALYVLEAAALLAGVGALTAFPTLTALLLLAGVVR